MIHAISEGQTRQNASRVYFGISEPHFKLVWVLTPALEPPPIMATTNANEKLILCFDESKVLELQTS